MSGPFYISTVPRVIGFAFFGLFVLLGAISFFHLLSGDPGITTTNVLASAVGALLGAILGYLTKENYLMDLKAEGKLDPDSDDSHLPPAQPTSTIPRLIAFIILLTLFVQGMIALLALLGFWGAGRQDWGHWIVTLVGVSAVALVTYFRAKRNDRGKSLENHVSSGSPSSTY